jgi:hypothetical protein
VLALAVWAAIGAKRLRILVATTALEEANVVWHSPERVEVEDTAAAP